MEDALRIAAVVVLAIASGFLQGVVHAWRFRMTGRVPTRVKVHWLLARVVLCLLGAFLVLSDVWWVVAIGVMAASDTAFRWTMAAELTDRGWHPLYLGASSYFDRAVLWWHLGFDPGADPPAHYRAYNRDRVYRDTVHDAGRTVYAAEVVTCLATTIFYIIHNHP
jgi:hypothetical protein